MFIVFFYLCGAFFIISKESVKYVQSLGKVCVLDIEIEGVKQIKRSDLNPVCVFIMPPSVEELRNRLIGRNTETPDSLSKRISQASREIEFGMKLFHLIFIFCLVDAFQIRQESPI